MRVEYRKAEYGDFDIEAVVDIALAIRPDAIESVADYVEWHDLQRSAGHRCERWLVSVEGRVVGSASVARSSVYTLPPEIVAVYVAVHPDHQRQGHGRALLERAEATASEGSGEKAYSWSDETQPRAVRFLERAGYREVDRGWQSTIDLTQVDPSGLRSAVDRVASDGIRIEPVATLASERDERYRPRCVDQARRTNHRGGSHPRSLRWSDIECPSVVLLHGD